MINKIRTFLSRFYLNSAGHYNTRLSKNSYFINVKTAIT